LFILAAIIAEGIPYHAEAPHVSLEMRRIL